MIQVSHTETASQLMKGDVLVAGASKLGLVESVDKKDKWMTVHFDNGTHARIEKAAVVTYTRLQKTEEELAAEKFEYSVKILSEQLSKGLLMTGVGILENAILRHKEHGTQLLSYSNLGDVLKAQAQWTIYKEIESQRDYLVTEGFTEDESLLAAYFFVLIARPAHRSGYPTNPLSRSSSVLDNIISDVNTYALEDMAYELRWTYREVVEAVGADVMARITKIKEERKAAQDAMGV